MVEFNKMAGGLSDERRRYALWLVCRSLKACERLGIKPELGLLMRDACTYVVEVARDLDEDKQEKTAPRGGTVADYNSRCYVNLACEILLTPRSRRLRSA